MQTEDAFMKVLQQADHYSISGNTLSLNNAEKTTLAKFEAAAKH